MFIINDDDWFRLQTVVETFKSVFGSPCFIFLVAAVAWASVAGVSTGGAGDGGQVGGATSPLRSSERTTTKRRLMSKHLFQHSWHTNLRECLRRGAAKARIYPVLCRTEINSCFAGMECGEDMNISNCL